MKTGDKRPIPTGADIVAGALVFAAILAVLIVMSLAAQGASWEARGASSAVFESDLPQKTRASRLTTSTSAICRIQNDLGSAVDLGSGTLIEKNHDGTRGVVLTCSHLFRDGVGRVMVTFPNGTTHGARLLGVDHEADLAALLIANPAPQPIEIAEVADNPAGAYRACGYGPNGIYRCAEGPMIGTSHSAGQMSMRIDGAVRSGDSGGAVLNSRGQLVAVIWGQAEGVTYASHGGPLRRFLRRVLGRSVGTVAPFAEASSPANRVVCRNGNCPVVRPRMPLPIRQPIVEPSRFDNLEKRIAALETGKQDRGNYASRQDIQRIDNESTTRHATLLSRIGELASASGTTGAAAAGLLGLSGPAGWAVLAAATIGGGLLGRVLKKRRSDAGGRRRRRFR